MCLLLSYIVSVFLTHTLSVCLSVLRACARVFALCSCVLDPRLKFNIQLSTACFIRVCQLNRDNFLWNKTHTHKRQTKGLHNRFTQLKRQFQTESIKVWWWPTSDKIKRKTPERHEENINSLYFFFVLVKNHLKQVLTDLS